MPKDFDPTKYSELLRESRKAFLADSAYAIAVAKTAGTFAARARERAETTDSSDSSV